MNTYNEGKDSNTTMMKLILTQLKRNKPYISIILILSCCIATIPQFILGHHYSFITGQMAKPESFYLVALNAFTHSPEILINHFIGNLLVIIIFGIFTETLIGSKRFAMISVLTFMTTTLVNTLHATGGSSHGVSGVVWGYQLFFIVFLISYIKEKGFIVLKDFLVLFSIFLLVFDFIGIALLEVIVLHLQWFQNFGQVLHIISLISVVPFIFLWRTDIASNIRHYMQSEPIEFKEPKWGIGTALFFLLVLINVYGVFKVVSLVGYI